MSLKVPFTRELQNLQRGQQMLDDVVANADHFDTEWSRDFATDLTGRDWSTLSDAQRAKVTELWTEQM